VITVTQGVKEGQSLRDALAANRKWGKTLHAQHGDFVAYYNKVRAAQPKAH
jgi:hypothetical protein